MKKRWDFLKHGITRNSEAKLKPTDVKCRQHTHDRQIPCSSACAAFCLRFSSIRSLFCCLLSSRSSLSFAYEDREGHQWQKPIIKTTDHKNLCGFKVCDQLICQVTHCRSPAFLHSDFIIRVAIVTGVEEGLVNVGLASRFTLFFSCVSTALFLFCSLTLIWWKKKTHRKILQPNTESSESSKLNICGSRDHI